MFPHGMRPAAAMAFLAVAGVLHAAPSRAQNSVQVSTVEARAGDAVVVPITAVTAQPLNLLSFDISFDPALCDLIRDVSVEKAGRAVADVQEGGVRCPEEGIVRIVFLNLVGGAAVPAGSGAIAEWRFEIRPDAPAGEFPLNVTVNQASNGPIRVEIEPVDGRLSIGGATACTTDCNSDGTVVIDELMLAVEIALGQRGVQDCPAADPDGDVAVSIFELIGGLNAAVDGCRR